jgi:hypothetical protein
VGRAGACCLLEVEPRPRASVGLDVGIGIDLRIGIDRIRRGAGTTGRSADVGVGGDGRDGRGIGRARRRGHRMALRRDRLGG